MNQLDIDLAVLRRQDFLREAEARRLTDRIQQTDRGNSRTPRTLRLAEVVMGLLARASARNPEKVQGASARGPSRKESITYYGSRT